MTLSEHYKAHVELLEKLSEEGDEVAARSLAAIILLAKGWRYGDPDPVDGPDDGGPDDDGGLPIPMENVVQFRRAA